MTAFKTLGAVVFLAGFAAMSARVQAQTQQDRTQDKVAFPAHTIMGNLHYVGTGTLNSYLITTPQGHILINTNYEDTVPLLRASIEKLGFMLSDIKIILGSHAHPDHQQADAALKELTGGASVMAMEQDVPALNNMRPGGKPHPIDRVLHDGDTVTLGGTTLRAIHAPGHTQGATIWMTAVEDGGRRYNVAFLTTTTPNPGVSLFDNPRHKNVVDEARSTFRKLKAEREPDIVLVGHPQTMFARTIEQMRRGDRPHPLLNGADAWTRQLAMSEADFERRVAREQPRR